MAEESYIQARQQDGVTVVSFTQPTVMDAYHVHELDRNLDALLETLIREQDTADKGPVIVLDLSTIRMLSSQVLSVFLKLRQKLEEVSGKMAISGIDPKLYRVFKITRLQDVFSFFNDLETAIESMRPK